MKILYNRKWTLINIPIEEEGFYVFGILLNLEREPLLPFSFMDDTLTAA